MMSVSQSRPIVRDPRVQGSASEGHRASRAHSHCDYTSAKHHGHLNSPDDNHQSRPWTEETVTFTSGGDELFGVLTLSSEPRPHSAIVIVHGSGGDGVSSRYYIDHERTWAAEGYATLRYDPTGVARHQSLDQRRDEVIAAPRVDVGPGHSSTSIGARHSLHDVLSAQVACPGVRLGRRVKEAHAQTPRLSASIWSGFLLALYRFLLVGPRRCAGNSGDAASWR